MKMLFLRMPSVVQPPQGGVQSSLEIKTASRKFLLTEHLDSVNIQHMTRQLLIHAIIKAEETHPAFVQLRFEELDREFTYAELYNKYLDLLGEDSEND